MMSYDFAGEVYETSTALSINSVHAVISHPIVNHARLVEVGQSLFALVTFQEGLAVLDLSNLLSPPSSWTQDAVVALTISFIIIGILVRRLPYMHNGHYRALA